MKKHLAIAILFFNIFYLITGCSIDGKWDYDKRIQFTLEITPDNDNIVGINHADIINNTINNRLEKFGIKKKYVKNQNVNTIIVDVPLYKQIERVKKLILQQGKLELKFVEENKSIDNMDRETLSFIGSSEELIVNKEGIINNRHIKDVNAFIGSKNSPYILVEFDENGAELFSKITGENIGKRLAIIIDSYIYAAPVIRERIIGGSAKVTGNFSYEEATDLAIILKSGSFPSGVKIQNEKIIAIDSWFQK